MWLRASYTVENAVITPLFMLIIIVVMRASCDIHDNSFSAALTVSLLSRQN